MSKVQVRTRCGFTLVELLVVIGIIALLIGILLPVLGKARMAGYNAKCLSNLRQLHQIGAQYVAENRGWCLPRSYGWGGPGGPSKWSPSATPGNPPAQYDTPDKWEQNYFYWDTTPAFFKYSGIPVPTDAVPDPRAPTSWFVPRPWLNAPRGMACPLAVIAERTRDARDRLQLANSYGYNVDDSLPNSAGNNPNYTAMTYYQRVAYPNAVYAWKYTTWTMTSILRAADKIEFADGCDTWVRAGGSQWYSDPALGGEITWQNNPPQGNLIAYRHGKWKVNIVFWDGHAETKEQGDILVKDFDQLNHPDLNDKDSADHYFKYWCFTAP